MRAIVLEGGGMKAAYANGVLATFEEAGFREVDAIYGTSAGGALAAWWSAGQARVALDTWSYVRDPRIMSYRRWLTRRGPLLDHDALFRVVYQEERPLDVEAVRNAPHRVVVSVTDADRGDVHHVDIRDGPVLDWLRATGRLPLGTGGPVEVDGRRWLDGGLTDVMPVGKAIEDGHDELIVILNRHEGRRGPEPRIVAWLVDRRYPGLGDLVRQHHADWNASLRLAEDPPKGVHVEIIRPDEDLGIGRLSKDMDAIQGAIDLGLRDGRRYLDGRG